MDALIDNSLLTGESHWVAVGPEKPVFAGAINQEAPLVVRVSASGAASRLGRTLRSVQEDLSKKAHMVTNFADRIAKWFVTAVLISVAIIFVVGLSVRASRGS